MPHQNYAPSDKLAGVGGRLLNFETLFGIELGSRCTPLPKGTGALSFVLPAKPRRPFRWDVAFV